MVVFCRRQVNLQLVMAQNILGDIVNYQDLTSWTVEQAGMMGMAQG